MSKQVNPTAAIIVEVTDENRSALLELALSMYFGEHCKYCGREFKTLDDLEDAVFAGIHPTGRVACTSCWKDNNSEEKGML